MIVKYLCDGEADLTIINQKLLEKLTGKKLIAIIPYKGNQFNSWSGKNHNFRHIKFKGMHHRSGYQTPEVQIMVKIKTPNKNYSWTQSKGPDTLSYSGNKWNEKIIKNISEAVKKRYRVMKSH